MTVARFLVGIVISQILFAITKLIFISYLNIESMVLQVALWIVLAVIAIATVRRMGVLNYFEAILITVVWTLGSLLVDLIITTNITGREVYGTWYFWIAYIVIIVSIVALHKKSHVEVRKMYQNQ